jgi:hypothetical protein
MADTAPPLPEPVRRFRAEYRADVVPAGYRGRTHAWLTFGGGSVALAACLWPLHDVRPLEWLAVPLTLVYANLAEYVGHRFPMHHPWPGLKAIYKRHAGQHHRFFTHDAMEVESARDFRALLFPPLLVAFFFGAFALPAWFVLAASLSRNVAWLSVASGVAYFLHYEVLHSAYHLPAEHPLARNRLIRRLRGLHRAHHDPALMVRYNFNITWPLGDWLFGTMYGKAKK